MSPLPLITLKLRPLFVPSNPELTCAVDNSLKVRLLSHPKIKKRLMKRRSALLRNASRKLRSKLLRQRPPHRKKRQRLRQLKKVQQRKPKRMKSSPKRKKM